MLSFQISIAMIAGATVTVALQRPNHLAFPLFFLLLLAETFSLSSLLLFTTLYPFNGEATKFYSLW